jgi:serine/threonine protein kinase
MPPDDVIHSTPAAAPPASPAENVDGELKRIGRYDLIEKIGRGGMGVVYRGRDTVIGRPVAVKMLISDIDVSDEARQRFFREARSAGQLAHRNIITIYDFGEEGGRAYIVMELLTGESLTNLLTRGVKLPLEQQVEIMMRVSEGLAFAHARGIVHRDVKPANLFVTTDGQVKILDFGVARIASSKLTRSGLLVGTPDYMSPEQVMGVIVDQRSDVFSAGAVFYQLLTGRKPFAAKRLPDVLNRVRLEQPEPVTEAEAPAELTAIVMKALEKDPAKRYQRTIEMLASLTRFLQAWDRQTRDIAIQAFERYAENAKLIEARGPRPAGAAEPDEDAEVAANPLLRDLPLFQDRGADVLKVVPFRRARIQEILATLEAQRDRLLGRPATGDPPAAPAVPDRD